MIASALITVLFAQGQASAVTAPAPLVEFKSLCVETRAALPAVTAAAAARGWTAGGRGEGVQVWSKNNNGQRWMLLAGVQNDGRLTCGIRLQPGQPDLSKQLPGTLGAAAINPDQGLYVIAASADAVRRGDAAFVSARTEGDTTMLLYIRGKR